MLNPHPFNYEGHKRSQPMDKKPSRILIVEDEQIVAKHIENHLKKGGYDPVGVAALGEDAVRLAAELQPDLILMDIRLAGDMDGIQAAEKIRARFNIPIIYLTAFADTETLERSRNTEPFGYLLKPFEAKVLYSTIEIALYKHRMEKKLKESETRFRTLAEAAPVGIFQTDIHGDFIYVNEKWCKMDGLSPEEASRKGWENALHPEDREGISASWYQMVRTREKFALEYRFKTPDGKITWLFGQAAALEDEDGNSIGYIGTVSDITDRKNLEEKLLTGRKLESLGILAGGIAHDFNNLLAIIMGNISLVREEITPDENHYKMLENAEKAATEAGELAQKLITFSKGGWLMKKKIGLREILENSMEQALDNVACTCETEFMENLRPVYGDENQLNQVFTNLLRNASEAMDGEGTITLRAENVELSSEDFYQLKTGKYVKVTIEDHGVGIPAEHMTKIFDPYFTTKDMGPQKGMGLGLTICYSIVNKHGGSIRLESEPGKGTTAEVYLPAFREKPATVVDKKGLTDKGKGRIMVVDDEPDILSITALMLEKMGYRVDTYEEGNGALDAYKRAVQEEQPFDAMLLDLFNKKGMGGEETLKKLLVFDPDAKVIAISGYLDDSDAGDLKKDGFCEVIIKPYRREELQMALSGVLPEMSMD
jgi:two-component system cell cycle sensor histidine kinase/response regulator CckA